MMWWNVLWWLQLNRWLTFACRFQHIKFLQNCNCYDKYKHMQYYLKIIIRSFRCFIRLRSTISLITNQRNSHCCIIDEYHLFVQLLLSIVLLKKNISILVLTLQLQFLVSNHFHLKWPYHFIFKFPPYFMIFRTCIKMLAMFCC